MCETEHTVLHKHQVAEKVVEEAFTKLNAQLALDIPGVEGVIHYHLAAVQSPQNLTAKATEPLVDHSCYPTAISVTPTVESVRDYAQRGCTSKVDGQNDCLPLALNLLCGRQVFGTMEDFVTSFLKSNSKKGEPAVSKYFNTGVVSVSLAGAKFDMNRWHPELKEVSVRLQRVLCCSTRVLLHAEVNSSFPSLLSLGATHFLVELKNIATLFGHSI